MNKQNRVIADLLNALDVVLRADSLAYAQGAASQAIKNAHGAMVRNSDGYLVVSDDTTQKALNS